MNVIDRVKGLFNKQKRGAEYSPTGGVRWIIAGGSVELSGTEIMRLAYVFACIRNISEDVAKMGIRVIRRDGRSRDVDYNQPLNNLFGAGGQPNHV